MNYSAERLQIIQKKAHNLTNKHDYSVIVFKKVN